MMMLNIRTIDLDKNNVTNQEEIKDNITTNHKDNTDNTPFVIVNLKVMMMMMMMMNIYQKIFHMRIILIIFNQKNKH